MLQTRKYQKARNVTVLGAIANTVLGIVKVVFGLLFNSQAVFADGIHSISDFATDILVLITAKIGTRAPDQSHPYGHGRVETIGTAVLGIVLFFIGLGIIYDALHHLASYHELLAKPLLITVTLLSIVTNEQLFRYTMKIANQINSNLLRANAWHKRSDALSSVVVIFGLVGTILGFHYFDAIAATVVALLVVKMGVKMVLNSIKELIDTGLDEKTIKQIQAQTAKISGVTAVHHLRSRAIAGLYYLDIHVQVDPYISVSESHNISDQVSRMLIKKFKQLIDVTVHIDIENDEIHGPVLNLPSREELKTKLAPLWKDLPGYDKIIEWRLHYLVTEIEIELLFPSDILSHINSVTLCNKYKKSAAIVSYIKDVRVLFTTSDKSSK